MDKKNQPPSLIFLAQCKTVLTYCDRKKTYAYNRLVKKYKSSQDERIYAKSHYNTKQLEFLNDSFPLLTSSHFYSKIILCA